MTHQSYLQKEENCQTSLYSTVLETNPFNDLMYCCSSLNKVTTTTTIYYDQPYVLALNESSGDEKMNICMVNVV